MEENSYKILEGSMLDILPTLQENSFDSCITDPPYELNFMGKGWDRSGIAFRKETWEQVYRVLKPGAYLCAFGGSRTFHRIACAIEDAGFEIRDTIMWLYGSGFPKSMDISKQIDKKGGNDYSKQFAKDLKQARESRSLTMKYCDDKYCNGSTNWSWYEGRKDGCRVPDYKTYLEIIKEFPELEKYRELIKEAEREVIGKKESGCFNNQEKDRYTIGSSKTLEVDITIPNTDLAKQWQGWGTCLKPAYEPIIVARKPFKGSLVDNVIENGVGGINIDECRVGNEHFEQQQQHVQSKGIYGDKVLLAKSYDGRFPANVILTYDETDFDEVCGGMPNTKSAYNPNARHENEIHRENADILKFGYKERFETGFNDEGSASRYFYCAKASKKDRDEGLDMFEEKQTTDGCIRANSETARMFGANSISKKNIHPTVKPIDLMQYLVRMFTPKGGAILEPFAGSGSTGKATMFENRERNANYTITMIEITHEYIPIIKARCDYAINKYKYDDEKALRERKEKGELNIFDFDYGE